MPAKLTDDHQANPARGAGRPVRVFKSSLDEMDDDDLCEEDVRHAFLGGKIVERLTDDPRGMRYVIRGSGSGAQEEVEVVCRFLPSGILRVITAYVVRD